MVTVALAMQCLFHKQTASAAAYANQLYLSFRCQMSSSINYFYKANPFSHTRNFNSVPSKLTKQKKPKSEYVMKTCPMSKQQG